MSGIVSRAYYSLANVSVPERGLNLGYKLITGLNLALKLLYSGVRDKPNTNISWLLADSEATVRIFDLEYKFCLRRNKDYNIYMNPFFHEYDVSRFLRSALRSGDVFIDVGAYAGSYTLPAASIVGPNGRVVSIEPNPESLRFLGKNLSLNHLENVVVIPEAAGEKEGVAMLFYDASATVLSSLDREASQRGRMWLNRLPGNANSEKIETKVTTLDEVYRKYLFPRSVDLIKIDTEGNDLQVLIGGQQALSVARCVITEQNTGAERHFLSNRGFKITELKPSGYLLGTKPRPSLISHSSSYAS